MCFCCRGSQYNLPHGHSGVAYLLFLWAYVATDAAICGAFLSWDLCFVDEEACVGSLYVPDALEQTA